MKYIEKTRMSTIINGGISMLKKCFSINVRRITRFEFWSLFALGVVINIVAKVMLFLIWQSFFPERMNLPIVLFMAIDLVSGIYVYIIGLKRFHDAGRTTGFFVVCFVLSFVIVGCFILLYVFMQPSDKDNFWGENSSIKEYEDNAEYYRR